MKNINDKDNYRFKTLELMLIEHSADNRIKHIFDLMLHHYMIEDIINRENDSEIIKTINYKKAYDSKNLVGIHIQFNLCRNALLKRRKKYLYFIALHYLGLNCVLDDSLDLLYDRLAEDFPLEKAKSHK